MKKNGTRRSTNGIAPSEQSEPATMSSKRSITPVFLAIGLIVALGCAFWLIWQNREIENKKILYSYLQSTVQNTGNRLENDEEYLQFLCEELAFDALSPRSFQSHASHYVKGHSGLLSITWVSPDMQIEHSTNKIDPSKNLARSTTWPEHERASQLAKEAKSPIYISIPQDPKNDSGFQVWVAAFRQEKLLGFFVGTYSCKELLDSLTSPQIRQDFSITIEEFPLSEGQQQEMQTTIHQNSNIVVRDSKSASAYLPVSNQGLCVSFQKQETSFSLPVILLGIFSLVFAISMSLLSIRQGKDLIQRRHAERELVQAKKTAEKASDQKGQFLADMSHEIRTPMTAILGYLELIGDSCPRRCEFASAEINGYIDAVQRNGHHLMELINSILDLSKIEAGKIEILSEACSLAEIISDVVTLTHPVAERKGLHVSAEIFTKIPKIVEADAFRVRQILVNLIGNAIKFTEKGSVCIKVGLKKESKYSRRHTLVFQVQDTGIGIPASRLESLFSPFSQADSSIDRTFGGTGLGLTISRMLARLMGGDLTVTSIEGKGSTFTLAIAVKIPSGTPILDELILSCKKKNVLSEKIPALHIRILLAEDGIDNQRLISTLLKKVGAEVAIAENGQKAVEKAMGTPENRTPFDLILMDIQMPVLDGYEATRKLRSLGYDKPIIALTANAMNGDRRKCIEVGCDDYLRKPIESERLFSTILRFSQKESLLELTTGNENDYNESLS